MFVCVDKRFPQDAVKLRGNVVVFNVHFRFQVEPAGCSPNFSFDQISQRGGKFGGVDLFLVQIARDIAGVHDRAVD